MHNTIFIKETEVLLQVYGKYTESNILPQKVIILQLHITCEKVT